jgi:hypothetical protein
VQCTHRRRWPAAEDAAPTTDLEPGLDGRGQPLDGAPEVADDDVGIGHRREEDRQFTDPVLIRHALLPRDGRAGALERQVWRDGLEVGDMLFTPGIGADELHGRAP